MSEPDFTLHPRLMADTAPVCDLDLSRVLLMDETTWPWLILVPRRAGLRELIDLPRGERHRLDDEIALASRALLMLYRPDKLNVAALGNVVEQLHVHVIARYTDDIAWPRPVWGVANARPYGPEELIERVNALRAALAR